MIIHRAKRLLVDHRPPCRYQWHLRLSQTGKDCSARSLVLSDFETDKKKCVWTIPMPCCEMRIACLMFFTSTAIVPREKRQLARLRTCSTGAQPKASPDPDTVPPCRTTSLPFIVTCIVKGVLVAAPSSTSRFPLELMLLPSTTRMMLSQQPIFLLFLSLPLRPAWRADKLPCNKGRHYACCEVLHRTNAIAAEIINRSVR